MAHYDVIQEVSLRLRKVLWQGISAVPGLNIQQETQIALGPPLDVVAGFRTSLWLYQVVENEFVKNRMPQPTADQDFQQFPPLALNLFYLLTPLTGNIETDQQVLGRAMQVFYDNARLSVEIPDGNQTAFQDVSIVLCRRTLEELTRIWDALREPYRLSVCYEVRLAPIDSRRQIRAPRIGERELSEALVGER